MANQNLDPGLKQSVLLKIPGDPGPAKWLAPFLEARYTKISKRPGAAALKKQEADLQVQEDAAIRQLIEAARLAEDAKASTGFKAAMPAADRASDGRPFTSLLQPGRGKEVLAEIPRDYWYQLMLQYRKRQAQARKQTGAKQKTINFHSSVPPSPGIPGANNWLSIGPSVVRKGQAGGRPGINGRTSGIAIAPGVTRVYIAAADGGVWRSDDGGARWLSTMENYDIDPTAVAATSLACGAIAIDPADPDRVYVGTGEGDANRLFPMAGTTALPSYRGVGPLRSDDGGANWANEPTATGSPTLVGGAFFQLAVDPGDRENVVGATSAGLYRREWISGSYQWAQKRSGVHSSVVVARSGGTTTFFAGAWGDTVYSSPDGNTWTAVGTGFPAGATRIGLAVQNNNPNVLYAMVASASFALMGVYRLDNQTGAWKTVSGAPAGVLGNQGDYDLAIAVDPNNVNVVCVAGQAVSGNGAIYRASVAPSGSNYAMTPTFIGTGVHADVHVLCYAPMDSNTLLAGCDGGVYKTTTASTTATFESCNTGLGILCAEYLGQHPTEPAVMFVGLQDNGTARYTGEECWSHINGGDGGYCVVNWNTPFKVLVYANGNVYRATDGGQDWGSWTVVTPPTTWQIMCEPLVGTPKSATLADADVVAFGAGNSLFVSSNFGTSWTSPITLAGGSIMSLIFASATRLFAGTTQGRVYRCDAPLWTPTRLDNLGATPLPLTALVSDIEVDPADSSLQSIYIAFAGTGDYRHVWHFDGATWQQRSGPSAGAATSLLDVVHNALIVDPNNPATLYAGSDIGVWTSSDGGVNWTVMDNGLPDAAVLDLQIHQPSRLMRAALYGRGVFQYKLDAPPAPDVQLYIRDTTYDLGLTPTVDWIDDYALWPAQPAVHWESPNIKVDVPTPAGYQTPTTNINFFVFNDLIVDGSGGVATIDPSSGTVTNRVYVEVHNRGISVAQNIQVMLLLADASAGLPSLPSGYTSNVTSGTVITTALWQTVGFRTIATLKDGVPEVVEFPLPSTMLPPPASLPGHSHQCLLAILHSAADPFTSTQTNVDALTVADRKVGQKNLNVVQFIGVPPPPSIGPGMWAALRLHGSRELQQSELVIDLHGFPGQVGAVFPKGLLANSALASFKTDTRGLVAKWVEQHIATVNHMVSRGRASGRSSETLVAAIKQVADQPLVLFDAGKPASLGNLSLPANTSQTIFLNIQGWPQAKYGDQYRLRVYRRDPKTKAIQGGATYLVQIVAPPKSAAGTPAA
jgi:hypothetical protein